MKQKRVLTFVLVCLMFLMQIPFSGFATDTDIRTELLSPDSLPDGRFDREYNVRFNFDYSKFNDGYQSYSWYIIDENELPPGLELVSQHSTWQPVLKGTPTKAGTYTFTIKGSYTKYTNGENVPVVAAIKTYTLTILPDYPLEFSTDYLNHGYGSSYSSSCYITYGRDAEWKLEAVEGETLPEGLMINSSTGNITWENAEVGKYNVKITATRNGNSISKVFKLIIEPEGGCKHTGTITKTVGKPATCKENGLADYWYCNDCERYFLDEQCKRETSFDRLNKLYTTAFHSDKNNNGKCDTCNKAMPIFKKVISEDEITSCGMYLVVTKIGDKYYTLKTPKTTEMQNIEAVEITKNADGTFDYFEPETGVMILKTEFSARCGNLDAGLPRYNFGTDINNIPYGFQGDGDSIMLYMYEKSKYGYRIKMESDNTAAITSVYSEYWSTSGKGGSADILSGYEETTGSETKRYFSFATSDTLTPYPIELYKMTYTGEANGKSYTLSDAQSMVTINNEFTVAGSSESNGLSNVNGMSEAIKTSYVESVISNQTDMTGNVTATTYADINLKNEETVNDGKTTTITSLVYEVTPKIEIKGGDGVTPVIFEIDDNNFNGSKMTLTLCVGDMNPEQIIHYKSDGKKEYFYNENSISLQPGQKTFSLDYGDAGNFVTFTVDSFSDIEILATAKPEPITTGNATITVPVDGQTLNFTATSDDPTRYSVEILRWIDVENRKDIYRTDLNNPTGPYYNYKFVGGKQYEAVVKFTAVGDYELSYSNNFTINGQKTYWTVNGLNRTYKFTAEVPSTKTVADGNDFTVTGKHINGYTVVLALYNDKDQLVDCQTAVYDGNAKKFTTTATDYKSAKVMVWENSENLKPVTGVEIVDLGQNS